MSQFSLSSKGLKHIGTFKQTTPALAVNDPGVGLIAVDMYVLCIRHRVGQYHSLIIHPTLNDERIRPKWASFQLSTVGDTRLAAYRIIGNLMVHMRDSSNYYYYCVWFENLL